MEHWLYYWKISCIIGRPIVVLEDPLYYWKSTILLEDLFRCWKMNGRSKVLLENQLYWRQSTGLDGNYRSRKITARRWLHKYVGAECGASSFTWYLYQMCNTDVRPSVRPERFPGICQRTHGGNGLKFYMLMYLKHLQNWLVYGRGLFLKFWHYFDLVKRVKFGVSGHFLEYAWRKSPEILHADASWPPSELISLWPRSVDFSNFGAILT